MLKTLLSTATLTVVGAAAFAQSQDIDPCASPGIICADVPEVGMTGAVAAVAAVAAVGAMVWERRRRRSD